MPKRPLEPLLPYAAAVAWVVGAAAARYLLDPVLGDLAPFATFFLATVAAAWFGGRGPGVLAVVLGTAAGVYWFVPPRGSLAVVEPPHLVNVGLFLTVGVLTALLGGGLRDARRRVAAEAAEVRRQKAALEREARGRQTAEEAIRTANRKTTAILESIQDGYLLLDGQWTITYLNPQGAALNGRTPDYFVGRNHWDAFPEAIGTPFEDALRRAMAERTPQKAEGFWPPLNAWIQINAFPGPEGLALFFRDVTDRVRCNQELHQAREQLRLTLDAMAEAVIVTDARRRITALNPAARRLTGWGDEAIGRDLDEVFPTAPEPGAEPAEPPVDQALRTGAAAPGRPVLLLDRAGKETAVEGRAAPFRDEAGAVAGAVLTFRDVSDARRAEAAVRANDQRLRAVLDHSPAVIFLKDRDGRYLLTNRTFDLYAGIAPGSAVGRTDADFFPPEVAARIAADDRRVWAGGRAEQWEEAAPVPGRGDRQFLTVKFPVPGPDGAPAALCGIATDVTDLRRSQQALREREERLRAFVNADVLGIVEADLDGGIRFANAEYLRITGRSLADFLEGRAGWDSITPPEWLPADARAIAEARARGSCTPYEKEYLRPDGSRVPVYVGFVLPGGDPAAAVAFVLDLTERKRLEAELRHSEDRLRRALEAADMVAWDWDLATDQVRRTPNARRILGLADGPAAAYLALIHPEDRHRATAEIQAAVAAGTGFDCRYRIVRPDGATRWVQDRARVACGPDGKAARVAGVVWDVTERVAVEEERQRLAAVVESATDVIGLAGVDGRILYFNEAGLRQLGLDSLEDARARTLFDFVPEGGLAYVREQMLPALAQEGRWEGEWAYKNVKTGREFPISKKVTLIRHPQTGVPFAYATVSRDITDRRRAEQETARLLERERAMAALLRKVAAAALAVHAAPTLEDRLRAVTAEARALLGAHQAFASLTAGPDGRQAIHVVSLSERYAPWRDNAAVPDGRGIDAEVCRTNRPLRLTQAELAAHPAWGGVRGPVADHPPLRGWLAAPFVGRDGRNLGLIQLADKDAGEFTAEDEAVLVQLANVAAVAVENARLTEELREADRRKDEFLATLAHELRNPLAPIRTGLQILRLTGGQGPEAAQAQAAMERQVGHMVRLVDDLLDVARISRGKIQLHREPLDVAQVIEAAVETSRPLLDERGHVLTVTVPVEPLRLEADRVRLAQVLSNLLNNAARYTDPGGHVWLEAERQGGDVLLRVRDTGQGIPPALLPRIFDPFVQQDGGRGGLGIGLTLVKNLVALHGGSVTAASEGPGRGSTFTVRLPLAITAPAPAGLNGVAAPPCGGRRVLVVDDNADAAESLSWLMRLWGHEVYTANDGPQALAAVDRHHPEVVLLDLGMPGMDGYEVARRLRDHPHRGGMTLIGMTGYAQEEYRERSRAAGLDLHLVKPIDPETIRQVVAGREADAQA